MCVHGASVTTFARVYVLYMQKNPALMEEGRALGLLLSIKSVVSPAKWRSSSHAIWRRRASCLSNDEVHACCFDDGEGELDDPIDSGDAFHLRQ